MGRGLGRGGGARAIALLVGLLALLTAGAGAAQSRHWNRIAYIDPTGRLATVRPDGGDPQVLTGTGERAQFPAWGPSGERIATIVATPAGGVVRVYDLRTGLEPAVTELYRSRDEAPFYLYWSPDGGTVSFLATHPEGGIALRLADAAGDDERVLAVGQPFYWQWAGDGSRLLLHSGFAGPGSRLGFTEAAADTLAENLADPGFFQAPGISASGRWIAYGARAADGSGVVVLSSSPGEADAVRRELPHRGRAAMAWSPVGDVLAVMSPLQPAPVPFGPIQLLDAETGELTTATERPALAFFWSPDGRHIAYFTPPPRRPGGEIAGDGELRVGQAASARQVQQAPTLLALRVVEVAEGAPVEGADRELALFTPSRSFLGQFLPFFDQYALSHRLWAPDGSAVVLPAVGTDGSVHVTVVPLEGEARIVVEGDTPFWNVR